MRRMVRRLRPALFAFGIAAITPLVVLAATIANGGFETGDFPAGRW